MTTEPIVPITIITDEGPREIRGETLGDEMLVVHRTLHGNRDKGAPEWTLSHVPSGHAIVMLRRRTDCIAVGTKLLVLLSPSALQAWRSGSAPNVSRRTPKRIAAWIDRCREADRCVEFDESETARI